MASDSIITIEVKDTKMPESERLVNYRLGKLEDIVERLTENQLILTRLEGKSAETTKLLEALHAVVTAHMEKTSKTDVKVHTLESQIAVLRNDVDNHKWALRAVAGAFIAGIVGAVMLLV